MRNLYKRRVHVDRHRYDFPGYHAPWRQSDANGGKQSIQRSGRNSERFLRRHERDIADEQQLRESQFAGKLSCLLYGDRHLWQLDDQHPHRSGGCCHLRQSGGEHSQSARLLAFHDLLTSQQRCQRLHWHFCGWRLHWRGWRGSRLGRYVRKHRCHPEWKSGLCEHQSGWRTQHQRSIHQSGQHHRLVQFEYPALVHL